MPLSCRFYASVFLGFFFNGSNHDLGLRPTLVGIANLGTFFLVAPSLARQDSCRFHRDLCSSQSPDITRSKGKYNP